MTFRDRSDAGRQLASRLLGLRGEKVVIMALTPGGVPVAFEVAQALSAPLDVVVVRKLGAPSQPELGIGAIAEGGVRYVAPSAVAEVGASDEDVDAVTERERREIDRRVQVWRGAWPPLPIAGENAIVIDDAIVTGGTMRAALRALRARRPRSVILAVPVAPLSTLNDLSEDVDAILCLEPQAFRRPVGEAYEDFTPVEDYEVAALLERAQRWGADLQPRMSF